MKIDVPYKVYMSRCAICHELIGSEEYEYSKTKPRVFQTNGERHRIPAKILYFHRRCYNELYHPNK